MIFDGLSWLGLDWDDEPVFQSTRVARHAEVVDELLARGGAYRCYMTQAELAAARAAAEAERRPFRLNSPWRDADPATAPADQPFVVRIKADARGRDGDRRSRPGPRHRRQCRARRHGAAALGRHADLHARGRRRRSRHGRDPRHPRRRSPQQRLPPAQHHPRDGLARAGLCAHPADPRRRRRASCRSATARWASMRIATNSASCPKRCSTICSAWAGATATTRSSRANRRSHGSTSTGSANRRRASIRRSSRT